jgi:hypothetical protein
LLLSCIAMESVAKVPREDLAVTTLRIERETLDEFRRVAALSQRTVVQEMRWLMLRHIAEANEQAAA